MAQVNGHAGRHGSKTGVKGRPALSRSVLRAADQVDGRYPEVCVLSGVDTSRAVRLSAPEWKGRRGLLTIPGFAAVIGRLPGRERCSVALPVSAAAWSRWRRRHLAGVATLGFGLVAAVAGAVNSNPQQIGFGTVMAALGVLYLTFANNRFWVTCCFRPATSTIIVEPTHARFDAEARLLYLRSV